MINLNTNIPSLIAQRSLNNSTQLLNQAIERMTTGFKINHASDNAANYSISTNMSTKISSYQVAEDNVAMGLDLLSTAGGSLDLISDKLSRLRALAEQAANGTYGEQSLKAINSEANAIVDEIERIYSTAEYNGIKLFDASNNSSQGISEGNFIEEVKKRDTSSMTKLSSIASTQTITSGTYSISTAEELAKLAEMTNAGKVTGGEFVLANNIDLSAYSTGEGWTPIGYYNVDDSNAAFSGTFDGNGYIISNLSINRVNVPKVICQALFGYISKAEIKNVGVENANIKLDIADESANASGLVGAMIDSSMTNCYSTGSVTGYVYLGGLVGAMSNSSMTSCYSTCSVTCDQAGGGLVYFVPDDSWIKNCYATGKVTGIGCCGLALGADGTVDNCYYNKETTGQSSGAGVGVTTAELEALIANGAFSSGKQEQKQQIISFQVGINSAKTSQITLNTAFGLDVSYLRGIGNDGNFFNQIDDLINKISSKQTEYGAAENRLESALEEISTQYDNLVSSRSTLRDADIAKVSSEYIRQQILQQASATLMATANQSPALALQLI